MANGAGLTEGEHIVLRMHPHWKTVLRPILIIALIVVAVLVVLIVLPASAARLEVRLGIGAAALVAGHRLVRRPAAALADHQLRADQPPPAAAGRDPVPYRAGFPAGQDQRRVVLAWPA